MNQTESSTVLKTLKLIYPYHFKDFGTDEDVLLIRLWETVFKDDAYDDVMAVVQKWSLENKYMPTIAEIKELLPKKLQITEMNYWHKRFGYGSEPIYYDDDFSESVIWDEVPKDIRERMKYHCNPKDYAEYNAVAEQVLEVNPFAKVKFYSDEDTDFLKGKMVTWTNEVMTI